MKKIFFISYLGFIFFSLTTCINAKENNLDIQSDKIIQPTKKNILKSNIIINKKDKVCKFDSDCVVVSVRCGDCGLDFINKSYIKSYKLELQQICKNHKTSCDMDYNKLTHEIRCVDLNCTLIQKKK